MVGFAIFYFDHDLLKNLGYLIGIGTTGLSDMYTASVLYEHLWLLLAACVLACPVAPALGRWIEKGTMRLESAVGREGVSYGILRIGKTLILVGLLAVCTVMMAGNTYSAFLYFRF